MNIQKILFPTDFSHYNDAALEYAATLAAESSATLLIVHVDDLHNLDLPIAVSGPYNSPTEIWDRSAIRGRLHQVVPLIADVRYSHHYLEGLPVEEIVKFAEREKVDLIVMASHGRSGLSRLLMGSIAEGVVRKAPCPVLIIKQPSSHPAAIEAATAT